MSRHSVKAVSERQACELGYDPGLATYYAQIYDLKRKNKADEAGARLDEAIRNDRPDNEADARAANDDALILWVGTRRGELETVEALAAALAPYARLTAEIREVLKADREREWHPPSSLQLEVQRFMEKRGAR